MSKLAPTEETRVTCQLFPFFRSSSQKIIILVLLTFLEPFTFLVAFIGEMTWTGTFRVSTEMIQVTAIKSFAHRRTIALTFAIETPVLGADMIIVASLLVLVGIFVRFGTSIAATVSTRSVVRLVIGEKSLLNFL